MRLGKRCNKYAVVLLGLALFAACMSANAKDIYKFRIQTAVPNSSLYFKILNDFSEQIEEMSGGRLQAKILPDGAVVKPFEIQDAVNHGVVEAGYDWPHYWSGKNSAYVLFSNVPASTGMDQRTLLAWFYQGEGKELYRHLNQDIQGLDIVAFLIQPMGPDPLGWFKEPIKNMDDFRNFKYRSPPGIAGQTYKKMGISAVAMPGGEIVPSAQRGVIDAAEWIGPADDRFLGLQDIWKYYYLQGLHQQSDIGELIINKDFWDGLPKDLQAIIRVAALAQVTQTLNSNIHDNSKALRSFMENKGIHVEDTPESYYSEFISAQEAITEKFAAENEFFAKVLQSQREYAKMVYPYWSRVRTLYSNVVETAHEQREDAQGN